MATTRKRMIVKAITWEVVSNTICLGLAYTIFGNFGGCLMFTGICFALKIGLFYGHECAWHRTRWGKQ